jgi:cell division protein FtsL
MFLPFVTGLIAALLFWYEKRVLGLLFTVITAAITFAWFLHHASDRLNINL